MLIFLYGNDVFQSREKLTQIKNKFLQKESSGSGLSILDFDEKLSLQTIQEASSASNLFSPKRLVIFLNTLKNCSPDIQKSILAILKSKKSLGEDTNNVFVFWEENEPKKNNALYKYLFANSKKQNFLPLNNAALSKWTMTYLKKIDSEIKITPAAFALLLAATGNDLFLLRNELQKLLSYADQKIIDRKAVELLVKARFDSTIFQTIEAFLGSNKKVALGLLHEQIQKGEEIYYIFSMYNYQLRNLLKIGDCYWNGNTNPYNIANETGLNPYVVQKSLPQLKNTTPEKLKRCYKHLRDIDISVKTGKQNQLAALDIFITTA